VKRGLETGDEAEQAENDEQRSPGGGGAPRRIQGRVVHSGMQRIWWVGNGCSWTRL